MCLPPSSGKRYRGTADAVFQNLSSIEESSAEYVLIVSGDQVYQMDYGELLGRHVTSGADLTIAAVEYPVGRAASLGVIEVNPGGRAIGFEEKPASPRPLQHSPGKALVNMGVYVFGKAALIEVLVSTGARIDADAELEAAIVLPGAHIGSDAKIRNAIVAENAVVSPNARIGYDAEVDWSQFPISEKGIVIVGGTGPTCHVFRENRSAMKAPRSIALASRRQK